MLLYQGVEVITLGVGSAHFHLLGKFSDKQVRPRVGRAKKHAAFVLRDLGTKGWLWARESKVTPITDRQHQINVFNYICRHQAEGAWLWTFRQGIYWPSTLHLK